MLCKYSEVLQKVVNDLGNDITYNDQLDKYACKVIPKKYNFIGVYPQDINHNFFDKYKNCCFIINTSPTNKEGEHWLGVWIENGKKYLFDSFGRNPEKLAPIFNKSVGGQVYYDDVQIQGNKENNCGQRTLAWLICCCKYGIKNAIKI